MFSLIARLNSETRFLTLPHCGFYPNHSSLG